MFFHFPYQVPVSTHLADRVLMPFHFFYQVLVSTHLVDRVLIYSVALSIRQTDTSSF